MGISRTDERELRDDERSREPRQLSQPSAVVSSFPTGPFSPLRRIGGNKSLADAAQEGALGQHQVTARVGVDNVGVCIHDVHRGRHAIERVGERSCFDLVKVEDLADLDRAAEVRQ
jgi:hypothetical protein